MAAALIPAFLIEYLGTLGVAAEGIAVSEGVNATVAGTVVGAAKSGVINAVTNEINDLATSIVGQENINKAKKTFDDVFNEAKGLALQDPSYFMHTQQGSLSQVHGTKPNRPNPTINFNTDRVPEQHHVGTIDSYQPVQNVSGVGIVKQTHSTKDVSDFLISYANEIVAQSDAGKIDKVTALSNVIAQSPKNMDLSKLLGPIMFGVIPKNDLYKSIASVYNGAGMEVSKNIQMKYDPIKKLIYFVLTDELGSTSVLYQTQGLIIPAYPGTVFMGPQSPNNNLPNGLVDLFSAFHDQSYQNGVSQSGDYRYISRLTQNYYRMNETEQKQAKVGILYFSTLGHLVSRLIGSDTGSSQSSSSNVPNVAVSDVPDLHTILNPTITATPIEKELFNKQFIEDIQHSSATHGVVSGNNFKNSGALALFESIQVEML